MIGSDVPAQRARRPRGSKLFKTPAGTGRLPSCQHPPVPLHLGHSSPPAPVLYWHTAPPPPAPGRGAKRQTLGPVGLVLWGTRLGGAACARQDAVPRHVGGWNLLTVLGGAGGEKGAGQSCGCIRQHLAGLGASTLLGVGGGVQPQAVSFPAAQQRWGRRRLGLSSHQGGPGAGFAATLPCCPHPVRGYRPRLAALPPALPSPTQQGGGRGVFI